jgi:hypothetical protein
MKKNTLNFWSDMFMFIDFVALIFTGVLLLGRFTTRLG